MATAPQKLFEDFEQVLHSLVARRYETDEELPRVIRYVLEGKGKRVRALLSMMCCEALGGSYDKALGVALSVEMVHAFSLVHDDLPCIDNDEWRRGRKTVHVVFNEAYALLAGDALLADAFHILCSYYSREKDSDPALLATLVRELSKAAGSDGMILGQMLDLYWTGRQAPDLLELDRLHRLKTGALLSASCAMGAACARNEEKIIDLFGDFGEHVGLAFQIVDDLLDEDSHIGKTPGKDRALGKATYLGLLGHDEARSRARSLTETSIKKLRAHGCRVDVLQEFVIGLLERVY